VTVIPDYRGFRIEVEPVVTGMRWNATVRILRLFSEDEPYVDVVTCLKLTPELAEHAGEPPTEIGRAVGAAPSGAPARTIGPIVWVGRYQDSRGAGDVTLSLMRGESTVSGTWKLRTGGGGRSWAVSRRADDSYGSEWRISRLNAPDVRSIGRDYSEDADGDLPRQRLSGRSDDRATRAPGTVARRW
jgi:hypothetical protein